MLRVLCVDDEKLTLQYLVSLCRDIPEISEVHGMDKPLEVLSWLRDNPCDLVFLDISMPETDGIRLSERIREMRPRTDIVFVTGHPRYAVESWTVHPAGYLLKPVSRDALQEEVDYVRTLRARRNIGDMTYTGPIDR